MSRRTVFVKAVAALLGLAALVVWGSSAAADEPAGFNPERHLRLSELQRGQRGYGMTVFAGVEPEPFAVEVVSIETGSAAAKSVIWMRALDERFELGGAAQGMSGSPIFIWTDGGADHKVGQGGKIAGALAYVYSGGKGAYFGVQPIEQMLAAAGRAKNPAGVEGAAGSASETRGNYETLGATMRLAEQLGLDEVSAWRMHALARLTGREFDVTGAGRAKDPDAAVKLALPLRVSGQRQAGWLSPLLEPMGIAPVAAPAAGSSLAPHWLREADMTIRPGGVLCIPLAFGPLELSAMGTVTDVLPDGTVLGFGHDFFAQGPIAVPMAGGYVHFIQPRISTSFKLGGSGPVLGAIIRDETTAVVGRPDGKYQTAPVRVRVDWPDESLDRTYEYSVVRHERLMPSLIGTIALESISADTALPELNTLTFDSTIRFAGGRVIEAHETYPGGTVARAVTALVPPISTLTESPYGRVPLESVEVTVRIEPEVRAAEIVNVSVRPSIGRPGESVTAHVQLRNFRGGLESHALTFKIPVDIPDGKYAMSISGADRYSREMDALRPHLSRVRSLDDLFDSVRRMYRVESTGLYGILRLAQGNNLAVGRTELPELPSSRIALLIEESSTTATPYVDTVDVRKPLDKVVTGYARVPVTIQLETPTN